MTANTPSKARAATGVLEQDLLNACEELVASQMRLIQHLREAELLPGLTAAALLAHADQTAAAVAEIVNRSPASPSATSAGS